MATLSPRTSSVIVGDDGRQVLRGKSRRPGRPIILIEQSINGCCRLVPSFTGFTETGNSSALPFAILVSLWPLYSYFIFFFRFTQFNEDFPSFTWFE